jgi:hypothetical protein
VKVPSCLCPLAESRPGSWGLQEAGKQVGAYQLQSFKKKKKKIKCLKQDSLLCQNSYRSSCHFNFYIKRYDATYTRVGAQFLKVVTTPKPWMLSVIIQWGEEHHMPVSGADCPSRVVLKPVGRVFHTLSVLWEISAFQFHWWKENIWLIEELSWSLTLNLWAFRNLKPNFIIAYWFKIFIFHVRNTFFLII